MKTRTLAFLRYAAFVSVALVTLVVLAGSWISFQGRKEWSATKADLLARGEKLSLAELIPPPIPDEQNFFGHPMWAELTDRVAVSDESGTIVGYRARLPKEEHILNVLNAPPGEELKSRAASLLESGSHPDLLFAAGAALRKEADAETRKQIAELLLEVTASSLPVLETIRTLAERPGARIPRKNPAEHILATEIYSYMLRAAQILGARANANLALEQSDAALADVALIVELRRALSFEPSLMALYVNTAITGLATGVVGKGIEWHAWTDANLQQISRLLSSVDLLDHFALAWRGERGNTNQFFETLQTPGSKSGGLPHQQFEVPRSDGWWPAASRDLRTRTWLNRRIQRNIEALVGNASSPLDPSHFEASNESPMPSGFRELLEPAIRSMEQSTPRIVAFQEGVKQTIVACALERYRLAHGSYPDSLDALVPAYLATLPRDGISGDPLKYQPGSDGFRLWSVGWNRVDDGGQVSRASRGDYVTGDWVWGEHPGPLRP